MTGADPHVEHRRFLRACAGGLSEKTAFVHLRMPTLIVRDSIADNRIRSGATALNRSEPLYGITDRDWPGAFLVPGSEPADGSDAALLWLGQWVVALTVAIQRWGRDPVWRGRVVSAGNGRIRLAIPWYRQDFFDDAVALAVQVIRRWSVAEADWDAVAASGPAAYFGHRWADVQAGGLGPDVLRSIDAALRRGLPFDVLPGFVQIGWGEQAERFDLTLTGRTSEIASATAKNKLKTSRTLQDAGLPVPPAVVVADARDALAAADGLGWPVVVKPLFGDVGEGVVTGIRDADRLQWAFDIARNADLGDVLLEKHCPGDDHRLLVVDGTVLQVARRVPAHVVGDGVSTIRSLVAHLNTDPRRGTQRHSLMKVVPINAETLDLLAEQGLHPDSVPDPGRIVRLARIANISAGGTAEDVTARTHPDNIALAQRAVRVIGLDIAGVDFLSVDISRSWRDVGGVICEVNAQPGLRPHWLADPARDLNSEMLDLVFARRSGRVPTAAITGTNGKTTTAEMLYRIWTTAGRLTGVCTTARVRIGDQTVTTDNLSGQPGARMILNDPAVQAAVLEMPRKGLIYFGHHCDRYDVAALLNVQDDHLGVDGIDTLRQMAELKAEVLERATQAIVVNAEDPLCLAMRARSGTRRHILVARTPHTPAVVEHRRRGGEAVFLDDRQGRPWIILATGATETDLMPVHDVPATLDGLLVVNETNAMFAAALAWAHGIGNETTRRALSTFDNTVEQNPGRYNFFAGLPFDVLVDFAHNPDGVRGVCSVAAGLPVAGRRLLCSLNIGNRHPAHFEDLAPVLASLFDEFVLGTDPVEVRGCTQYAGEDPSAAMVARSRELLLEQGVDRGRITGDVDRRAAIRATLDKARPGDLVVLLADYDEAQPIVAEWVRRQTHRDSQLLTPGAPWDD